MAQLDKYKQAILEEYRSTNRNIFVSATAGSGKTFTLCELAKAEPTYKEVGKYPSIKRDIALLADRDISSQEIINVIKEKGGKNLVDIHLFDVFEGEKLGHNKKSLAYSLIFRNDEATLVDEEVTNAVEKVSEALQTNLNIEVR